MVASDRPPRRSSHAAERGGATGSDEMRENPGLDLGKIAACLEAQYGLRVATIAFLPVGYDLSAAVYEVATDDGTPYFLKIWSCPIHMTRCVPGAARPSCNPCPYNAPIEKKPKPSTPSPASSLVGESSTSSTTPPALSACPARRSP